MNNDLHQFLIDILDYLEPRQDINYEGDGPNRAMQLYHEASDLLKQVNDKSVLTIGTEIHKFLESKCPSNS